VIRLWAIRKATAVFQGQELYGLLAKAQHDVFLPVRREVLHARVEQAPEKADEFLRLALFDRSPSMRELARFYLSKQGVTDFVKVYRDKLKLSETDVAIAGIGETGGRPDAGLVVPYFRSDVSRVRKAAVRAAGQLASGEFIELLVERLSDDSAKVSQEAARSLGDHVFEIGTTRLWRLFQNDDRQHVKISILTILDKCGTWHRLPFLIEAAAHQDHRISVFAVSRVERSYNRVFTHPSANEQQLIFQALDHFHESLDAKFRDSVRHWVVAMSQKCVVSSLARRR